MYSEDDPAGRICFDWKDVSNFAMALLFIVIFALGAVLNLSLLYAICKEKLYHSTSNLYIINLAVSDLVIAIGVIFFPFLSFALTSWPFGALGCRIVEIIRDVVTPVSLLTLTAMSIDRYQAINSKSAVSRHDDSIQVFACVLPRAPSLIFLMWLVSIVSYVPITLAGRLVGLAAELEGDRVICMLDRYEFIEPKILVVIRCTITYVIPLAFIGFNYSVIVFKLIGVSKNLKKYEGNAALDRSRKKALSRAKVLLLLIVIFVLCSFPCHFFLWMFYFFSDDVKSSTLFWDAWRTVGFYLFYLYPILNPVFLYATSEEYRSLFDKYLFRRRDVEVKSGDDDEASTQQSGASARKQSHPFIRKMSSPIECRV